MAENNPLPNDAETRAIIAEHGYNVLLFGIGNKNGYRRCAKCHTTSPPKPRPRERCRCGTQWIDMPCPLYGHSKETSD